MKKQWRCLNVKSRKDFNEGFLVCFDDIDYLEVNLGTGVGSVPISDVTKKIKVDFLLLFNPFRRSFKSKNPDLLSRKLLIPSCEV